MTDGLQPSVWAAAAEDSPLRPFELYEAVLQAQSRLGQGIALVDMETNKVLYANEALCEMTGYSAEEILALPSFFSLADAEGVPETLEGDYWETVFVRKDGTRTEVEAAFNPISPGESNFYVALLRDISERKETERALRESEARWRTLINATPVVFWAVDRDGILTLSEGSGLRGLGLEPGQVVGQSAFEIYADNPDVIDIHNRALAGETVEQTIEVEGRIFLTYLVPGAEGVIGVATDVTDWQRAEAALADSEQRHRSVLSSLQEGVLMVDRLGRILAANPAAQQILDPEGPPLKGNSVSDPGWSVVREDGSPLSEEEFPVSITLATGESKTDEIMGLYRPDGTHTWISVNTQGVFRAGEELPNAVVVSLSDVTERRRFEAELRFLADHDALTGLPNRRRFNDELQRHLNYTARYGGKGAALLLDLDNFKYLNDSQGHKAGDQYLVTVARVLQERLRQTDVVARLGGDEFGVLLPAADAAQARHVAENLQAAVREHAPMLGGQPYKLSTSIGIACFGEVAAQPDELLAAADLAMYEAKESGRDTIAMAGAQAVDERSLQARMRWLERIKRAIDDESFILYCQPIQSMSTGAISQYELLLRMQDDDGQIIAATAFLSTAERFDLIQDIDRWVIGKAIDLIAEHKSHGRDLRLEVNISAKSIGDAALTKQIEARLRDSGIDPAQLILEITETTAIANMDEAVDFANRLSRLGCGFALDDFGRGFGSFYYLKHLPLNYLKIDGDFIRNLAHNLIDQQVVKAVVQVAKALGYKTIAEYVQDDATLIALKHYEVDYAQGFHVGRPRALNPASSGFL